MKCESCQPLIEDYFDGELEQQIYSQVSAHMEHCSECAQLATEIKLEREIYSRYHREVDVSAALWANVHARIRDEKQNAPSLWARVREWLAGGFSSARLSPVFVAALLVFAIGITVGIMTYLQSRTSVPTQAVKDGGAVPEDSNAGSDKQIAGDPNKGGGKDTQTPAPSDQPKSFVAKKRPPTQTDPNLLVRQAEQKYVAAIAILSRDLGTRRQQLDPDTRARFDFALAEIDDTIYATRQAVRGNPSDPIALGYLLTAYSKKVEFLRDTASDDTEANRPN